MKLSNLHEQTETQKQSNEREKRTYTIEARSKHLDKLELFLNWINSTSSGHSGTASLSVDGDGAARFTIKRQDGKKLPELPEDMSGRQCDSEFHVGID